MFINRYFSLLICSSEEAARLREDVDKATTVLQKLTSSPPEALGLGAHRMPKSGKNKNKNVC